MKLNQVAHLQTEIAHAYMRKGNLSPSDFVELDRKYGILRFYPKFPVFFCINV